MKTVEQAAKEFLNISKVGSESSPHLYIGMALNSLTITAFKAGAKWQKEQDGWISVENGLPNNGQVVDTWDGKGIERCIYDKYNNVFKKKCGFTKNIYVWDVAYWRKLPKPPKK